jgi:MFS family permease
MNILAKSKTTSLNLERRLLTLDSLFEGGRMFVGATSAMYLLSRGLTLSDLAFVKSIQAVTVFLGEIPSGLVADSIGRRGSLFIALCCSIAGFLIFSIGQSLAVFVVAEILTALALCFWSGAYESYSIDTGSLESDKRQLNSFFHKNQSLNSLVVAICGLVGGLLGQFWLGLPYLTAAIFAVLAIALLLFFLPAEEKKERHTTSKTVRGFFTLIGFHLKQSLKQGILDPRCLPIFFAAVLLQFVLQPILHFWQPLIASFSLQHASITAGNIFFIYSLSCFASGYLFSKLSGSQIIDKYGLIYLLFGVFSILYFLLARQNTLLGTTIVFCLLQAVLAPTRTMLTSKLNAIISSPSRASVLSSLSFISRIGMLISLAVIGGKATDQNQADSIRSIFIKFSNVTASIFFVIVLFLTVRFFWNKTKHKTEILVNKNAAEGSSPR